MDVPFWAWAAFVAFVALMIFLDLAVLHRHAKVIEFREAAWMSLGWVALALIFGVIVWMTGGAESGGEYFAGYLIEKALSVDNIFVFALIFTYFAVPAEYQHRVLVWGVIGALIMRGIFIFLGAELLEAWDPIVYVFAAVLIITGIRMATHDNSEMDPSKNVILRAFRRMVPVTEKFHGAKFWVRKEEIDQSEAVTDRRPLFGVWIATPLLATVVMIESADLVFAIDSIPAIFAITTDTFIVFTSNAFALLGLRALYFMLSGAMERFVYLQVGLSVVLVFVGLKFIWGDLFGKVPIWVSLPFIAIVVGASIAASLFKTRER